MKYFFLIGAFFYFGSLIAQVNQGLTLRFVPSFQEVPFLLANAAYSYEGENALQIETLRFYISRIQFYQETTLVFAEENSFHLIDAEAPETLQLSVSIPTSVSYNQIKFCLGIDSLTNASGALGGALDPMHGMYWTWQSGYINFKLEGLAKDCPARNHRFQFHLGGFQAPFNALQEVALSISNTEELNIRVAVDHFFTDLDLASDYQVMSPSQKAMELSQRAATIFSIIE